MNSLREEIERRLASNQQYYAHFVTTDFMQQIRNETANDIIKIFEKRINSIYIKHPNTAGIGHNECLDQIKREMLKK